LRIYSYATCDVTVTHDKSVVGLVETKQKLKIKIKPNPSLNPNRSPNLILN